MPRWPLGVLLRCAGAPLIMQPEHARLEELPVWLKVNFRSSAFSHSCSHCLRKDQWAEPLRPRTPLMASAAQVQLRPQRAGAETQGAGSPAEGPVPSLSHRAALCSPVAGMSLCSTSQSDATRGTAAVAFVHSASVRSPAPAALQSAMSGLPLTPLPVDVAQRLEVHFHPWRDVRRA